ncbi:alpha/beta fold hydrolase [Fredinandcohnia humi]
MNITKTNLNEEAKSRYMNAYAQSLELWPEDTKSYYIRTLFGDTHVLETGVEDNPPLILLHGGSMSSTMWYPNVSEWNKHYRVLAIDILGDKNKSVPEKTYNDREDHAKWLAETLDEMQIKESKMVGLSYGALNLINFLQYYPNRVSKGVIMSPAETFVPFNPEFYTYAFGMVQNEKGVDNFLEWLFNDRYTVHSYIKEQLVSGMMWIEEARGSKPKSSGFPYVFTDDELSTIQTDLLLLLGENEVMYNPSEVIARATRVVPTITVELVEKAGHLVSMEQSTYINKRVLDYLRG